MVALSAARNATKTAPYEVTADDKLWLARAVEAEGPPRDDVARTLVNLFVLLRTTKGYKGTLTDLVRAYAQPVNPRWYPDGDLFKTHLLELPEGQRARAVQVAQAREQNISTKQTFAAATGAAVRAALSGSFPLDWTDYAAPGVGAARYVRRTDDVKGKNTFYTRSPGWAGYVVGIATGPTVAAVLLLIGFALWRNRA